MSTSIHVNYICANCGATDSATEPNPPRALNCWKCHAGSGKITTDQQLAEGIGMIPEEVLQRIGAIRAQRGR